MNTVTAKRSADKSASLLPGVLMLVAAMFVVGAMATGTVLGRADNFTDIFYTKSFRGAFEWIYKLDWVGMLVQIVISTFSLFGVALMVIRIMTSMLFLSAKGLWEEVHDLKNEGSDDKDFIGLLGMAKTWKSGRAGTGLDAIIGVVLILLPDVKKYSDFGDKAKGDLSEECTITQYMLKIALPTVMTVFFFAMGFNGTLFKALAVTVDAMGVFADQAVSVNYAGLVSDLVNSHKGFTFTFDVDGTNLGKLKQRMANDMYAKLIEGASNADPDQLYNLGLAVEEVMEGVTYDSIASGARGITESVASGLVSDQGENYVNYIGYEVALSTAAARAGTVVSLPKESTLSERAGLVAATEKTSYILVICKQNANYNGNFFSAERENDGFVNAGSDVTTPGM